MPTLAPRLRPPLLLLKVDVMAFDGSVMFIASLEKILPSSEIMLPAVGCCVHAPLRTVNTKNDVRSNKSVYMRQPGLTVCEIELLFLLC